MSFELKLAAAAAGLLAAGAAVAMMLRKEKDEKEEEIVLENESEELPSFEEVLAAQKQAEEEKDEAPAEEAEVVYPMDAGSETPNANPVDLGAPVAPKDENGKFDVTKIASAEDFGNWDDLGCQG